MSACLATALLMLQALVPPSREAISLQLGAHVMAVGAAAQNVSDELCLSILGGRGDVAPLGIEACAKSTGPRHLQPPYGLLGEHHTVSDGELLAGQRWTKIRISRTQNLHDLDLEARVQVQSNRLLSAGCG